MSLPDLPTLDVMENPSSYLRKLSHLEAMRHAPAPNEAEIIFVCRRLIVEECPNGNFWCN